MSEHRRTMSSVGAALLGLAVLSACESPAGPVTVPPPSLTNRSTLQIRVDDRGAGLILEQLTVRVDDRSYPLANDAPLRVHVDGGQHEIELMGLTSGCAVVGDNPRRLSVPAGRLIGVILEVDCLNPF